MSNKFTFARLIWDDSKGYGYVEILPEFRSAEPITCLDAINDWAAGLSFEYKDQHKRSIRVFEAKRKAMKRATKLATKLASKNV